MVIELAHTELGCGTPLIILHGLFGSKRNWGTIAKALSAHHRVFSLDLRNHGDSPWDTDMRYEALAADVTAFIHRHGLAPCTVMGHSMGGKTAMTLALNTPHMVARLVVVDIAPVTNTSGLHAYVKAMIEVPLADCPSRADVDAHLSMVVPNASVRQFLLQNLGRENGTFSWRLNLTALDAGMDDIHGFPHIPPGHAYLGPTTFITGGASDYVQPEHEGVIKALFPKARIIPILGAGHWLHAEAQEAFLKELWRALEG